MVLLTIADLTLFLKELLETHLNELLATASGRIYEPLLREKQRQIATLPPSITRDRPLADELAGTDQQHDGAGAAIYYMTEAYLRYPGTSPEIRAAAERIRAAFVPMLSELQEGYADEAARAMVRRERFASLNADLSLLPVATNETLSAWARYFVTQGDQLRRLLSERVQQTAPLRAADAAHEDAGPLRGATIGILNRLRAAMSDEMSGNSALPQDLDFRLFGLLDELLALRSGQARRTNTSSPAPSEPTGTPV